VRGILKQKLADGDTDTALKLAEKAFALKPKHEETQDVLLRLQAQKEDWSGARSTLNAKLKYGSLPRDVYRRRDAVLALSEAKDILSDDSSIEMQEKAIAANKLSPDLIPAAVMAAKSYIRQERPKLAARLLKKAWEAHPHPDLASAFAAIEPEESPAARIKRFQHLTRIKPDDPETRMLLAELHIANEDFPEARRALGDLVETDPTARSVTLMAAIERGEGSSDSVVRGWLAKALTVSRGPQWICENCQHIHAEWMPICENCESFDTLAWKTPPMSEMTMPGGAQMLPLIVGALEDKSDGAGKDDQPEVEEAELLPDGDGSTTEDRSADETDKDTSKAV
jgi:HemY protein